MRNQSEKLEREKQLMKIEKNWRDKVVNENREEVD